MRQATFESPRVAEYVKARGGVLRIMTDTFMVG